MTPETITNLLFGGGKLLQVYDNKRRQDFERNLQLQSMQEDIDRMWQLRAAAEAQNAALLAGMEQQNQIWGDYYNQYQSDLPQFSPEAKQEGLDDSIAAAVGRQTQAVQEAHSADMGGGIKGRVSADYSGGLEGAASGSLARALNRARLRGRMTGYDTDKLRESGAVADMGYNASAARRGAADASQRAAIEAKMAGYVPPQPTKVIPGYESNYGAIGDLLMTGANLYNMYQMNNPAEKAPTASGTGLVVNPTILDDPNQGLGLNLTGLDAVDSSVGFGITQPGVRGQGGFYQPGVQIDNWGKRPASWADL